MTQTLFNITIALLCSVLVLWDAWKNRRKG